MSDLKTILLLLLPATSMAGDGILPEVATSDCELMRFNYNAGRYVCADPDHTVHPLPDDDRSHLLPCPQGPCDPAPLRVHDGDLTIWTPPNTMYKCGEDQWREGYRQGWTDALDWREND